MSATSQISGKPLTVHGLTKRMGECVLWSDLNLEFLPGQMTALTGQSGCGKTTLLNVLGLLERPTSGVVAYGARDLTNGSSRTRRLMHRNVMGFMFQNYALVEQWTVARNLQLALRCVGVPASERRRLIRRALHVVHLDGYDKRLVYTLSGGEQQRVAIARIVIRSPRIVLADEPTAALDAGNRAVVMQHLRHFADDGAIVIYTTHNEKDAADADRIIKL